MTEWFFDPTESFAKFASFWFGIGLVLATAVTVFGVFGEYKVGDDKAKRWFCIRLRGFELIVAAGVAAEMLSEGGTFWYSDRLQMIQGTEIASLMSAASWREFSREQHDNIVSLIRNLPTPLPIKILFDSVVGNPEAQRYGMLLSAALSDGLGVSIDKPPGLSTCLECTGVWVCVNDNATTDTYEGGRTIRAIFEAVDVGVIKKLCTDPKNGMGDPMTVKVIVGPKEQE